MNIYSIYNSIIPFFRRKRMNNFKKLFHPDPQTRILDVGGNLFNWLLIDCPSEILIVNIDTPPGMDEAPKNFTFVKGDGTALAYADNSFDLAYSNSVIEHVGTFENQMKFASEMSRVAGKLWVQTPARSFFIEPHLMAPFVHLFPKGWQKKMIRWFTVWGLVTKPSKAAVEGFLDEVRLLDYDEMVRLFPDCTILRERFLGMTKCYIAVRQ